MNKPCKTYTDIQRSHITINKTGKKRVYSQPDADMIARGMRRRRIEDLQMYRELNDDPLFDNGERDG